MRAGVHILASFWLLLTVLLRLVVQSVYLTICFQSFHMDAHEWDCWGTGGRHAELLEESLHCFSKAAVPFYVHASNAGGF